MNSLIDIEQPAPEFATKAYFPSTDKIENVKLSDFRGKWVILTFYPGDFTFVCATDIEAFMQIYDDFKNNNAEIFAVSTDSVFSHKGWVGTSPRVKNSKIPMLEDFNKKISTDYGFLNVSAGSARRGVVIIDPDGKVQYISLFNDGLGKDAVHIYTAFMGLKYLHDTPSEEGHMCAIPANWKIGDKALDINIVKDIGKL